MAQGAVDGTSGSPGDWVRGHAGEFGLTQQLRRLFDRPGIIRAIGAHDALGARLGERAGFDAIWSSGLEISASHGVPDADLLTMSELLDAARWMAGAVALPVVADGDAGYGNATNVAYMVRRYEAAGVAAVCIEDKPFPKMNSFVPSRQRLVPVSEFTGKIEAAKHAQHDPAFMVIARVEALVVGMGLAEALRRAHAYAEAGADAILVHAKDSSPAPILEFLARWKRPVPIVVVPTTYHQITASELAAAGAKMVIYANHGLRAGVRAVSETFQEILRTDGTAAVEERIAPLSTIFDLQGVDRLQRHDERYVRTSEGRYRAILVAPADGADAAAEAGEYRATRLDRQSGSLRQGGVDTIVEADPVASTAPPSLRATAWTRALDVARLLDAGADDPDATLIVSGDRVFDARLVRRLLAVDHDIVVAVHRRHTGGPAARTAIGVRIDPASGDRSDLAGAERVSMLVPAADPTGSDQIGGDRTGADADAIGLVRLSTRGAQVVRETAHSLGASADGVPAVLARLLARGFPVHYLECPGGWQEAVPDPVHAGPALVSQ
jgi:phosphoenolpyruvate phosphomutase